MGSRICNRTPREVPAVRANRAGFSSRHSKQAIWNEFLTTDKRKQSFGLTTLMFFPMLSYCFTPAAFYEYDDNVFWPGQPLSRLPRYPATNNTLELSI